MRTPFAIKRIGIKSSVTYPPDIVASINVVEASRWLAFEIAL
jgi:hypothetical protein